MGDRVHAFEQVPARAHRAAEAVAVSSCTAGLQLAIEALGIGPGADASALAGGTTGV
jgi:dTDP-4-amino-4,6-dideoxygalactose transaminase